MDDPVLVRCPWCNFHHWRPAEAVARMASLACHRCRRPIALAGGEWREQRDKWGHTIRELVARRE